MILSNKQEAGLKLAVERYRNKEPYTVISGFAGVGKTTLLNFIISALEIPKERIGYCAPTGRAAQVMQSKGCHDAMTIHRLLYEYMPRRDGTFFRKKKDTYSLKSRYDLIIVDELSMVDDEMWSLLLSHNIPVIACGDPYQLSAINNGTTALDKPHIFLDEVMRQAQESEIIRLTMAIREGKKIEPYKSNEVNIVSAKDLCSGMFNWSDQTICATNKKRVALNSFIRTMKFGTSDLPPQEGEKCICLKNNWDIVSDKGEALVNGSNGIISDIFYTPDPILGQAATITFNTPEGIFPSLLIDWKLIMEDTPTINEKNFYMFSTRPRPNELTYGYAISAHKAQGGEWPKVLVIEENFPFDKEEHARWLYTACTRAQEKITLVLKK